MIQRHPFALAADPGLILGMDAVRVVQAADGDVDLCRVVLRFERQLCAAVGAERARAPPGGLEPGGLAAREPELRSGYAKPRDRWRARGAAADRAVAARLMEGIVRGFVTDLAAEAAALERRSHVGGLGECCPARCSMLRAWKRKHCGSSWSGTPGFLYWPARVAARTRVFRTTGTRLASGSGRSPCNSG